MAETWYRSVNFLELFSFLIGSLRLGITPLVRSYFFPFWIIASTLVRNSIEAMKRDGVDEVGLVVLWFRWLSNYSPLGRSWNRVRQLRRFIPLWILGIYSREATISFLSQWERRLPTFVGHPSWWEAWSCFSVAIQANAVRHFALLRRWRWSFCPLILCIFTCSFGSFFCLFLVAEVYYYPLSFRIHVLILLVWLIIASISGIIFGLLELSYHLVKFLLTQIHHKTSRKN